MSSGKYIFVDKVGGSMDAPKLVRNATEIKEDFFSLQQIISSPIYTFSEISVKQSALH